LRIPPPLTAWLRDQHNCAANPRGFFPVSKTNAAAILYGNISRLTVATDHRAHFRARVLQCKTFAASDRSCALLN
jgi:hypothetical protein